MSLWLARVILWSPIPLVIVWGAWCATKGEKKRIRLWLATSATLLAAMAAVMGVVWAFVMAVVTVWNAP